jgi:hypothetical protein
MNIKVGQLVQFRDKPEEGGFLYATATALKDFNFDAEYSRFKQIDKRLDNWRDNLILWLEREGLTEDATDAVVTVHLDSWP